MSPLKFSHYYEHLAVASDEEELRQLFSERIGGQKVRTVRLFQVTDVKPQGCTKVTKPSLFRMDERLLVLYKQRIDKEEVTVVAVLDWFAIDLTFCDDYFQFLRHVLGNFGLSTLR